MSDAVIRPDLIQPITDQPDLTCLCRTPGKFYRHVQHSERASQAVGFHSTCVPAKVSHRLVCEELVCVCVCAMLLGLSIDFNQSIDQ